ncbi:MAG: biopolymer transporter ExbD [Clostridia bacterium]|nr:biopolymer transporter ExbD [Clostridia bacterium]
MLRRRLNGGGDDATLASVSDIAFLLIIFFMVTSVFAVKKGITIIQHSSRSTIVLPNNKVISVTLFPEKITVNGMITNKKELPMLLSSLKNRSYLLFRVSERVKYYRVIELLEVLKKSGISRISLRGI